MEKDSEMRGNGSKLGRKEKRKCEFVMLLFRVRTMNESDRIGMVVDAYQQLLWQNVIKEHEEERKLDIPDSGILVSLSASL